VPHRLGTIFSVISLALCLAVAGLWARSYFSCDRLDWSTASGRAGFFSFRGRLGVGKVIVPPASSPRILHGLSYRAQTPVPAAIRLWLEGSGSNQWFQVMNMPAAAAAITAVASHPMIRNILEMRVNWPMIFLL
jgi:hypothetical protein